jgi:hypothetical protein
MKKLWCAALITLCAAASLAAQTDTSADVSLLNLNSYASNFGFVDGQIKITSRYITSAPSENREKFGALGSRASVDTPLEFALLSYYSPITIEDATVRVNAENALPKNNPRQADLKLGVAVYQEMRILRFLGDTAAAGRHEGIIKFITDRGNVSRAEIESYYRQGIRSLIAEAVDVEFNKVEFKLDKGTTITYNAMLICDPNTQTYKLSYERPSVQNDDKEIAAPNLNALIAEMRKNGTDFDQASIDQVRTQVGLLPAARLGKDSLNVIKLILEQFYLRPTVETYGYLKDVYALYNTGLMAINALYRNISSSYVGALSNLSQPLAQKVLDEHNAITPSNITLSREQQQRLLPNLQQ